MYIDLWHNGVEVLIKISEFLSVQYGQNAALEL